MSSEKGQLIDSIQKHVGTSDLKFIAEMEKLFALDPDPIIRVRMDDAYQKLNHKNDAVKEYVRAADPVILEVTEEKLREVISQRPRVLDVLKRYSETRTKGTVDKILETNS